VFGVELSTLTYLQGFKMIVTDDLDDAATKSVKISQIIGDAQKANLDVAFSISSA
jgi:hypothetical protein